MVSFRYSKITFLLEDLFVFKQRCLTKAKFSFKNLRPMIVQQKCKKQSGADKLEKQNYIQHKALRHWYNSCTGYINIKKHASNATKLPLLCAGNCKKVVHSCNKLFNKL